MISFTATRHGRVTMYSIASAMSSAVSRSTPSKRLRAASCCWGPIRCTSYAAAGATEQAKAALQQVAADAGRRGALRLRDAAAHELRALGTRIAPRNRHVAGGDLTERERTVAEMVAEGRSNKQVAAELFLSEGTIENTLTRVYAKLGVRSRTQLTGAL